jgi:hypothetical protein
MDDRQDTIKYKRFQTVAEFWSTVASFLTDKQKLLLIAHNISYDFGILDGFNQLEKMGFALTSVYSAGMTNILQFRRTQCTIQALDNMNYFRCSLAVLGDSIGLEKLEVDWKTKDTELLSTYCRRDVEIMVKAWQTLYAFIARHNLGCFAATLPAQAMKAYKHRFMQHKILINHEETAIGLERAAYHGGRCSIFYQGTLSDGPYYKLDVNSMYPYVMQKNPYPAILKGTYTNPSLSLLEKWLPDYAVIARVKVNTPVPVYVKKYKGHCLYPTGKFITTLTTPEIEYGLNHGFIEEVEEAARYTREMLFREYVDFFYPLKARYREEGNKPFATMVKYYLNTLYGKFGQKAHSWRRLQGLPTEYTENEAIFNAPSGRWRQIYHFGSEAWETTEEGEARDSFPGIAAHVGGYARMYLWELLQTAGMSNCFYCDTDCLIVNQRGYDNLATMISESDLGMLKVESIAQSVTLLSPKHYAMGDEWTRKGVPSKAEHVEEHTWSYEQFPSIKGQAKVTNSPGLMTKRVTKTLFNRIYDGRVEPDGHIVPLLASTLIEQKQLPAEIQKQIERYTVQINAIRESRIVASGVVFKLWNYATGDWKKQRNKDGELVPIEYSDTDSLATELGFNDLNSLQTAIINQLSLDKKVIELKRKLCSLRDSPETDTDSIGTIQF